MVSYMLLLLIGFPHFCRRTIEPSLLEAGHRSWSLEGYRAQSRPQRKSSKIIRDHVNMFNYGERPL